MARKKDLEPKDEQGNSGAPKLEIHLEPGETVQQKAARIAVSGVASNAYLTMVFGVSSNMVTADEFGAIHTELKKAVERTKSGGTEQADEMLTAQAVALNQVFMEMGRRAALNMNQYPEATDTYLRLALKAQSQCRQTLESLAEIRNPRHVAFVKQANIANGHQQVNNGPPASEPVPTGTHEEIKITQVELLEDQSGNVTRLDARAPGKAGRSDPAMETVGAVHGTANGRGKGSGVA